MTSSELLADAEVPPKTGVFFLGCFESRVTVLSQQVRALNLVDAILEEGRIRQHGRVAIIGGGAAGMTAAAALAAASPELEAIDLYERKHELLHLQRQSTRYLHPHIYDWPAEGSMRSDAGLPLLDWQAGPAGQVADAMYRQFDEIRRAKPIRIKTDRLVNALTPFPGGGCRIFVEGAPKDGGDYDAAIISIGFGYERLMEGENKSYWSPFALVGPIRSDREHVIFVSGNGDGGLVDFIMAAFNGMEHEEICRFITSYEGLDETKETLLHTEEYAWNGHEPRLDLYLEYTRHVLPTLPKHLLLDVRDRLRDAQVWLHTREPKLFRRDTAILNRFGSFLVVAADRNAKLNRIHLSFDKKLIPPAPLTGPVTMKGKGKDRGTTANPLYRFLRFGPEREANFKPFQELVREYKKNRPSQGTSNFLSPTPTLTESAETRFTLSAGGISTAEPMPPTVPAPSPAASELQLFIFGELVAQSVYIVLAFDSTTIFSVPMVLFIGNTTSKTIRNVNLTLEMSDSLYLHGLERTPDKLALAREVQVVTDAGRNEHIARVLYRFADIPPKVMFQISDHIFAKGSTIHITNVPTQTKDGVPVTVSVRTVTSRPITAILDGEDVSPRRTEVHVHFREGDMTDFDSVVRRENELLRETRDAGSSPIQNQDITFMGFRRFSQLPDVGLRIMEADPASAIARNMRIGAQGLAERS